MPQPNILWAWGKCGYKAILYLAHGLPVVATDIGAARTIIRRKVHGRLSSSIGRMADSCLELLMQETTTSSSTAAERIKYAKKMYSSERDTLRLTRLYNKIAR